MKLLFITVLTLATSPSFADKDYKCPDGKNVVKICDDCSSTNGDIKCGAIKDQPKGKSLQ